MKSNSKLVQTGLIVVVIGIWGMIGYRIYNAMGDNVEVLPSMYVPKAAVDVADVSSEVELDLDYRDPFTGKAPKRPKPKVKSMAQSTVNIPIAEPVPPSMVYNGYSYNQSGALRLAIKVNGSMEFVKVGETVEGCTITSFTQDKLTYRFEGKGYEVSR